MYSNEYLLYLYCSKINGYPQEGGEGGGCGSVVKHLSGMCKALGLMHRVTKAEENRLTRSSTFGARPLFPMTVTRCLLCYQMFSFLHLLEILKTKELSLGKGVYGYS